MSFKIVKHPLIEQNIGDIRNKLTGPEEFRQCVNRITLLLFFEMMRNQDIETYETTIETPLEKTKVSLLIERFVVVAILRAGLGMVDAIVQFMPEIRVYHLGMKRNEETLAISCYYNNLPDLSKKFVIVVDPMLATGGTMVTALEAIVDKGSSDIRIISLIAAPKGIDLVEHEYPRIPLYVGATDRKLNSKGYILPGLGDAGDRIHNT